MISSSRIAPGKVLTFGMSNLKNISSMKKKFRINFVISYAVEENMNSLRAVINSLFVRLSWLYQLEYAIKEDYQFATSGDFQSPNDLNKYDLIFLRSTEYSIIDRKSLHKVVLTVLDDKRLFPFGVELYWQPIRVYNHFRFPEEYDRPMKFPYIEHYKDGHKTVCIAAEALDGLLNL